MRLLAEKQLQFYRLWKTRSMSTLMREGDDQNWLL
jgi:hypothetical protein